MNTSNIATHAVAGNPGRYRRTRQRRHVSMPGLM
jgi:hypothetical protein